MTVVKHESEAYPGGNRGLRHGVSLPEDLVATNADGCYIETASGDTYLDYMLGSGAVICGHSHPHVTEAIQQQAERVQTPIAATAPTIELSQRLVDAVPCADQVIFSCTGSQANYLAIRLARSFTGKDKLLKFEGAYHGFHDAVLKSTSWGDTDELEDIDYPDGTVDSGGILQDTVDNTLIAPFNDRETTEQLITDHADDLAAVIVEPVHRSIPPEDGFFDGLRDLCDEHGILLIFDEIVTGFRVAWGGAQELYDVTPDLATYGKTMTGGTPIGAVCGRKAVMELADPGVSTADGGCLVGSTMNGNALCAAAANATLDVLADGNTYQYMNDYADRFRQFIEELLADHELPVTTLGVGPIVDFAISETAPTDWRSMLACNNELQREIEREVMHDDILLFAGSKKYISLAHDNDAFEKTTEAYDRAVERVDVP